MRFVNWFNCLRGKHVWDPFTHIFLFKSDAITKYACRHCRVIK